MQRCATRPWITAVSSAAIASAVVAGAVTPVAAPAAPGLPVIDVAQIRLVATDMVLDLVRHGQSTDNADGIVGTTAPGAPLTDLGKQQSITVGEQLYNNGDNHIDGVYASEFLRTQQTAWPLDQLMAGNADYDTIPGGPTPLLDPSHILAGLNEVNAGFFNNTPEWLGGLPYILPIIAWAFLGQWWVPMLGSANNFNGIAFEERFSDAVNQIYANGGATAPDGAFHDVAFTHGASMLAWTLMTVKNPDLGVILKDPILPNTGQVVVEGNPTDGWTLVSWDGHDVAATPDLITGLLVDIRDLITAPQMAAWNFLEALGTFNLGTITSAAFTGLQQVFTATVQFPFAVLDTVLGALGVSAGTAGAAASDAVGDTAGNLAATITGSLAA